MRALLMCLVVPLLALVGCSDSSGPESIDLTVTATWDRMNEAGFVADRWAIWSVAWGAESIDTLAAGSIPGGGSPFVIEAHLDCPMPNPPVRLLVWGMYEGRSADAKCEAVGWFDQSIDDCAFDAVTVTVGFTDRNPGFEQPTDGPQGVGCDPPAN